MLEIQSNFVNFVRQITLLQLAESLCLAYEYKIFEVKADWLKRLCDVDRGFVDWNAKKFNMTKLYFSHIKFSNISVKY